MNNNDQKRMHRLLDNSNPTRDVSDLALAQIGDVWPSPCRGLRLVQVFGGGQLLVQDDVEDWE